MEKDGNYFSPFGMYDMQGESPDMYKDPMFSPIMQYEQAYSYYKYLCMQMDYKIKCKEYEKMCNDTNSKNSVRKND